jgi:hypothetical protein
MKYIISESQYDRFAKYLPNTLWILRRYEMVKKAFMETSRYLDPCKYDSFDRYETEFYYSLMDDIHESYYLIDGFDYEGVMEEIKEMFYVDLTEDYFKRRKNC